MHQTIIFVPDLQNKLSAMPDIDHLGIVLGSKGEKIHRSHDDFVPDGPPSSSIFQISPVSLETVSE
jgi:hypothetical protein